MQKEIAGVVRINPEGQPRFCPSDMGTDAFTIKPGDKLVLTSGAKLLYGRHAGDGNGLCPRGRLLEAFEGSARIWAFDEIYPFNWAEVCGVLERPTNYVEAAVAPQPELKIGLIEPEFELPDATVSAPDLLGKAAKHMADRATTYDKPGGERSMAQTVAVFEAYHGIKLSESQGWHFMQILKDVRLFTREAYHADSAEDCIAFAALKAEARAKEGGAA